MKETVWTGEIDNKASNPDNWTDGLPNSDKQGIIPEDYVNDCNWDISDFTINIRVEGNPVQISIDSNCFFNGECYAPESLINYVDLLQYDRPMPYPGDDYLGMSVDFPDVRETATYIIAASDASTQEKGRADKVCPGTADDVIINYYFTLLSTNSPGRGEVFLSGGLFVTSDTIDIPYGATLRGSGMGRTDGQISTHINWTGAGAKDIISYNSAAVGHGSHRRGNGIFSLTVDGNDIADSTGIRARTTMHHSIKDVTVKNTGLKGIIIEASFAQNIIDCDVTACGSYGISLEDYGGDECTLIKIKGCEIGNCTTYNLSILSGAHVTIDRVWFENGGANTANHLFVDDTGVGIPRVFITKTHFGGFANSTLGILIQGGDVNMTSNRLHCGSANNKTGLQMTSGNLEFVNNHIFFWGNSANGGAGLDIDGGSQILINSNSFIGNATYSGYAIDVAAGTLVQIHDNNIRTGSIRSLAGNASIKGNSLYLVQETEDHAIYSSGSWCDIIGNHISSCERNGIYVETGSRGKVTDNFVYQASRETDDTYDAIYIDQDKTVVTDNNVTSSHGNTPRYGIHLPDVDWCTISHNLVQDTSTNDIFATAGTHNTYIGNILPDGSVSIAFDETHIIWGNQGYIAPGEIRTSSNVLTAGNANAIFFAWANPEAQDILIRKVVIEITTPGGTGGCELDVGIADDAAGTNRGTEFFDDIDGNAADVNDSFLAGDGGTQTKWVLCEDSASVTDDWIVGQILTQNAASLVGRYYIEYSGR